MQNDACTKGYEHEVSLFKHNEPCTCSYILLKHIYFIFRTYLTIGVSDTHLGFNIVCGHSSQSNIRFDVQW